MNDHTDNDFREGIAHLHEGWSLAAAETYWLEAIMNVVSLELGKRSETSNEFPAFIWAGAENGWEPQSFTGSTLYVNIHEHDRRHDALLAKLKAFEEEVQALTDDLENALANTEYLKRKVERLESGIYVDPVLRKFAEAKYSVKHEID